MSALRKHAEAPSHSPIYMQLANRLRGQIESDFIRPGDALPSERDLCTILGASRVTVRKSIELLIDEGLLTRRQGSGTFVTQRIQAPGSFLSSFSEEASGRGETSETRWISKLLDSPTEEEARLLELPVGAQVARISRVRKAGGEPLAIENAVIPAEMLPELDQLRNSLYRALEKRGNRPMSGEQKIRAGLARPAEAKLLDIPEHSEILRIERLTRRADGRPVELTRSSYRGERYEFLSELRGSLVAL
jgi:GntR family transcriptional regulator